MSAIVFDYKSIAANMKGDLIPKCRKVPDAYECINCYDVGWVRGWECQHCLNPYNKLCP